MKKLYKCLLIFTCLILFIPGSRAAKFSGGELYFKSLGNDSFLITAALYKDCNDTSGIKNINFTVQPCSGNSFTVPATLSSPSKINILCKKEVDRCSDIGSQFPYGIEKYEATARISLKSYSCCNFTVSLSQCCRSSAITTATSGQDFYLETSFNKCYNASSPVFNKPPGFLSALNSPVYADNSVKDPDGDSVVYKLIAPLKKPDTAISYASGYSSAVPIRFNGYPDPNGTWDPPAYKGIHLSSSTGLLNYQPTKTETAVMAIKVEKWRKVFGKSIKIGEVTRDYTATIIAVPNSKTNLEISGADKTNITTLRISPGKRLLFNVYTKSTAGNDSIDISWNNGMPATHITTDTSTPPVLSFDWTPDTSHLRSYPYSFALNAIDYNACPIPERISKSFKILVTNNTSTFSSADSSCGLYYFTSNAPAGTSPTYTWKINDKVVSTNAIFSHQFHNQGLHYLHGEINYGNGEGEIIYDTIFINSSKLAPELIAKDTTICFGSGARLAVSSPDTTVNWQTIKWEANSSLSGTNIKDPLARPQQTTTYYFSASTSVGCTGKGSLKVTVIPNSISITGTDTICKGDAAQLHAQGVTDAKFRWFPAIGLSDTAIANPIASPLVTTTYYATAIAPNSGCMLTDSFTVFVHTSPLTAGNDTAICAGSGLRLNASGGKSYSWSAVPSATISSPNTATPFVSPAVTSLFIVTAMDNNGCISIDTVKVKVNANPAANAGTDVMICTGDSAQLSASGGIAYSWSPAIGLSASNIASPYAKPASTTSYVVTVTDSNGCSATDTVKVTVEKDCVWPGDANNDKVVNAKDLLPIGAAFGTKGFIRPNASINWNGQYSKDWKDTLTGGINFKHADCNGDSTINKADTLAIHLNYSKSYKKTGGALHKGGPNDPLLKVQFFSDSLNVGDTAIANINYGTSNVQAQDVYGLAFTLNYDPKLVDSGSIRLNLKNSWLFNDSNHISIKKDFYQQGKMDVAITRIDKKNKSGYGSIGTLQFVIIDNIAGKDEIRKTLTFSVTDVQVVNAGMQEKEFNLEADSAIIKQKITRIKDHKTNINSSVKIYPNPAREIFIIDAGSIKINQIRLVNMLGQTVLQENKLHATQTSVQTTKLDAGIYILTVITSDGIINKTLIIEK